MNFLILSAGRRCELVRYFVEEFKGVGNVVVTDCSSLAPALYVADKAYIVPPINNENYIDVIKKICVKENIKGLISLIDPELSLIAANIEEFNSIGVTCFISNFESVECCFDKYSMFKFLDLNNFNTAKTFNNLESLKNAYEKGQITYPVFIKPQCGSASINVNKVNTLQEVELYFNKYHDIIVQEFLDGTEIGVDVYVDVLSGQVISIFAKEKIKMRAGETDKSKSIICPKLFDIIQELVLKLKLRGPIDIDVFKINNNYYISEINPRFGGGYPHAYQCGVNFIKMILNNLNGNINNVNISNYNPNVYAIKSDTIKVIREEQVIS